jgi:hypothetical protein
MKKPEPERNFYTNTSNTPVEYGNMKGFVTAKFRGWAVSANGKKFWVNVYGLSINFSAEGGEGVRAALERQWKYKVKKMEKVQQVVVGAQKLPEGTRILDYVAGDD